jgi:hypothetical protein
MNIMAKYGHFVGGGANLQKSIVVAMIFFRHDSNSNSFR